jgi:hypothetical protein
MLHFPPSASPRIDFDLRPNNGFSSRLQDPSDLITVGWNVGSSETLGQQGSLLASASETAPKTLF